ncbi:MAG: MFS transporter [Chloroflexi bacterium]|nr:MFS transporter [Chloroflexota bacterium]
MSSPGHAVRRRYQSNIWKFYLYSFLLNFQLWWPIWIIYLQKDRGLSLGQITLLDVPFWLGIVVLQVPAAAIADRWGRKPTLAAAALFGAAAVTIFGLATTFWLLLASYLIWAASFSLLVGPDSAFLFDTLRALGREGEYQKLYGFAWAMMTGATLAGTLAGAPLAAATNLSFPIVLSGGMGFAAFLSALLFVEPLPEFRSELSLSYRAVIRDSVRLVVNRPTVRYAILYFGVVTLGTLGPIFFLQPFLTEHGVGIEALGLWQTPTRVAGMVGALIGYRVVAAMGERMTFQAALAAMVASYVFVASWGTIYAVAAFPVMNLLFIMSRPLLTDYLNRRVSSGQRATVVSMTNLAYAMALAPVAPLLGALADSASLTAAFWAAGAIVGGTGVLVLALWAKAEQSEAPVVAEAETTAVLPRLD